MIFTPIDTKKWPRQQMFWYYTKMAPTGYSITVELDVTKLYRSTKQAGIKFFAAYLWLVTDNLNHQIEFKTAEHDGIVGYYDTLTPLYASFHDDDKTFSLMWTEYKADFSEFYEDYIENQRKWGENHGVVCRPDLPPENSYVVSCVPWISFKHFAVHSYDNKPYYFPSIEAGKFFERDGKLIMPLSLTCHHATTDGYHVDKFLHELQSSMDNFELVIKP